MQELHYFRSDVLTPGRELGISTSVHQWVPEPCGLAVMYDSKGYGAHHLASVPHLPGPSFFIYVYDI